MVTSRFILGFLLAISLPLPSASADGVLVVCPQAWQPSMQEWVKHRSKQGHSIQFVSPANNAQENLKQIVHAHSAGSLKHVVLVGDAALDQQPATETLPTPTNYARAIIAPRWGSGPQISTDHTYADLKDGPAPELSMGRIPVDSAEQLRDYCDRVVAFEHRPFSLPDEDRLTIVAAPGNFGPLIDRVIESTAVQMITQVSPPSCALHLTYADWHSPYCPYPAAMTRTVREGLNSRSRAWLYLGHAHKHTLDRLQTPLGQAILFDQSQVDLLSGTDFPPFAAIVACYTGSFEGADDCLAENLVRHPAGPLAVFASSRICMPYGNSSLGLEALTGLFESHHATLGEVVKHAKVNALKPGKSGLRRMVETIAAGMNPKEADRQQERIEHVQMYNLLGDPLLRIERPRPVDITAELKQDNLLTVSGVAPYACNCRIQLQPARGGMALLETPRNQFALNEATQREYSTAYHRANHRHLAEKIQSVAAGPFAVELNIPAETLEKDGKPLVVTCHLSGEAQWSAGHTEVVAAGSALK